MPERSGEKYNVVVIGGGTAGLVTAAAVATLGGRVALVERHKMGGDCLNYGCVPSKALIAAARRAHQVRTAGAYGVRVCEPQVDFPAVLERMRACRAAIAPHDSPERFESLGVDVVFGSARFVSPWEVRVQERVLRARNFVIATGTSPAIPPIEGLESVPYYTNETIFDELRDQPRHLAVIGGGPIGCELGQVFRRLGSEVTLIEMGSRVLVREDPEISEMVQEVFRREGIDVRCGTGVRAVHRDGDRLRLELTSAGADDAPAGALVADAVLVAAGRRPNIADLGLEAAGVETTRRGVRVNRYLQTTAPHIYAAGDVVGSYQFTHVADAHARIVVHNLIAPWPFKASADGLVVPWCTYTDPEVAHVGHGEASASEAGLAYDVWRLDLGSVDRAVVDGTGGHVKVLTARGMDRIIGATIVGPHAGDILHEFVVAIKHGIGLKRLSATIHAYPTLAELARRVGDQYMKSRLTPFRRKVLRWLLARARR